MSATYTPPYTSIIPNINMFIEVSLKDHVFVRLMRYGSDRFCTLHVIKPFASFTLHSNFCNIRLTTWKRYCGYICVWRQSIKCTAGYVAITTSEMERLSLLS